MLCNATYTFAVDASSYPSMCTDEWLPTVSAVCPLGVPRKKGQGRSRCHAQNEAQTDHPQRISWLLVAVLNATHISGARLAKDDQF